ncbi:MAG: 2Fe-2S iron-sulfur cluster-binding protein [Bacteroidota bacterium]
MAKITFITSEGETLETNGSSGSIMELAVKHSVKGIDGDCGGVCSCATCHVHVDPADFERTGGPGEIEADMLELDDNASEYSRLSCQLEVSESLDGLVLKVAN